jgi:hypothetical protein
MSVAIRAIPLMFGFIGWLNGVFDPSYLVEHLAG